MRIQHNIMAMNAYRNYTNNVSAMKANLEKLSSGYKINRAGDDAAGLAISEKMRAQITGLQTAQKNAKDGISLVQTAEGALTEVHDMLNRMVELATQSANGTYDNDTDREQLQKELDQLRTEINRIADSSNFNGIKLLDGSMDAEGGLAATSGNFTIPAKGNDMYTDTILNQTTSGGQAQFKLELHNSTHNLNVGDTLTVTVGGDDENPGETFSVDITDANKDNALKDLIAEAFLKGDGTDTDDTKAVIGGVKFDVTAAAASTDNSVTFIGEDGQAFEPNLKISLSVTQTDGATYAPTVATPDAPATTTLSNLAVVANGTGANAPTITAKASASAAAGISDVTATVNFDADAIAKAIVAKSINAGASAADLTISQNDAGKWELKLGEAVIATADALASNAAVSSGAATRDLGTLDFKYTNADGTEVSVGTVALTADASASVAGGVVGSSTVFELGGKITATPITTATAAATAAGSDFQTALASAVKALQAAATASDAAPIEGALTVKANASKDGLEVWVGGTKLDTATATIAGSNVAITVGGQTMNISLGQSGVDIENLAAALGSTAIDTGVELTAGATGSLNIDNPDGSFNEFTTQNVTSEDGIAGRLASTTFDLTADKIKDGAYIQIGNEKYQIKEAKEGEDNRIDAANNTIYLKKELLAEGGDKLVDKAGELLSRFSDSNTDFTIVYNKDTNKVSVHEKDVHGGYDAKEYWDVEGGGLDTVEGFQKLLGFGTDLKAGKGLTLQIGDTADDYNKLTVNISDMHTAAMGIGDISIEDQESAAEAVKAIKNAINYVSDVRGTLGATQNRLDHTINNLSVMTENIQDAESTIRDTDVAEEMMAYTKNNILIQSAQAMLAQANQVPQGVLQLLQ